MTDDAFDDSLPTELSDAAADDPLAGGDGDALDDVAATAAAVKDKPAAAAKGRDGDAAKAAQDAAKELERLRSENQQLAASERYWAEKAKARDAAKGEPDPKPRAANKAAADDDGDDDPEKFLETLTAKGPRAIAAYMKKQGFVTAAEAEALAEEKASRHVEHARKGLAEDAELFTQYPDLRNQESEFFKEAGAALKDLVARDPAMGKSAAGLFAAAAIADARVKAAAKAKPDRADDPDRLARIRAQQGDRGGGRAMVDDDPSIGPGAEQVIKAFGIKPADYLRQRRSVKQQRA